MSGIVPAAGLSPVSLQTFPSVSIFARAGACHKTEKLGNITGSFQAILTLYTGWGICDLLVGHQ